MVGSRSGKLIDCGIEGVIEYGGVIFVGLIDDRVVGLIEHGDVISKEVTILQSIIMNCPPRFRHRSGFEGVIPSL